jgi:Skp family chaperone for outer membrane proteins
LEIDVIPRSRFGLPDTGKCGTRIRYGVALWATRFEELKKTFTTLSVRAISIFTSETWTDTIARIELVAHTIYARRADVRFNGLKAIALAIITTSVLAPVAASADEAGHRIAVVDVAYIFKNHEGIKGQVGKVEKDLKSYDTQLKGQREELKQAIELLKEYKVGTPKYAQQEEQVAGMESKLRLEMNRKRKELADAEARIYYDNYQLIATGVKFLAQHYKINLVLRYNSEDMDLEKGDSVIRGVMKNIVYHDKALDMTQGVMQYLDKTMNQQARGAAETTTK